MSASASPIVVWCGRFSSDDGYGAAARSHVKAMRAAGVRHIAVDSERLSVFGDMDEGAALAKKKNQLLTIRAVDNCQEFVVVTHERPDRYATVASRGRCRRVGYSYFEAATLPRGWATEMTSMDEVWTSSQLNRRVFSEAGVPDWMLRVLPHPVDVDPSLIGTDRGRRWRDTTVFLTIVSGAHRRDLRALYEAFSEAFEADEPVLLVLKVRPGAKGLVETAFRSVMLTDPGRPASTWPAFEIIESDLTREQLHRLQASADVYVSVERGDGWCLPAFESMALERPVISFDWGGSSEFIDNGDCYVVPVSDHLVHGRDSVPVPNPQYDDHLWPSVDPMDLAAAFTEAAGDPDRRRQMGKRASKRLWETMDMRSVGEHIKSMISEYVPSDYLSNAPAVIELVETGSRWNRSTPPAAGKMLDYRLIALLNEPAFLRPSSPREWAKAYKAITEFAREHRSKLPEESPVSGPVSRAMSTSLRSPLKKTRAVGALRTAGKRAASSIGGVEVAREVTRTMHDYRRCVSGQTSEFDPDECAERRRKVWNRFGGVRTPSADLERLRELRGRHHGERIFILGNGPSLNGLDLALLKDEFTFGVNKIYLKFPDLEWTPTFYTLLDWRMGPSVARDLEGIDGMTRFYPERFRGMLPITDDTYWYWPRPVGDAIGDQFAPDATRGIPSRATVLVTAIQLAFHLGFREIVLIGVDASYTIPTSVIQRGQDRFGTGTKLHLESTADDDPNHFDRAYFGTGAKWHDPNVDDMRRMFRIMRKGVERHGGRLLNGTLGGSLECLERVDYAGLFD